MDIVQKVKQFIFNLNEKGLPVPLARNPDKDAPDIAFTFFYISGCILMASLIGKLTKLFGDIDTTAAGYAFLSAGGLYLGRRMSGDTKKIEIEDKKEDDK